MLQGFFDPDFLDVKEEYVFPNLDLVAVLESSRRVNSFVIQEGTIC